MKKDDFLKAVRGDGERFRVDDIVIATGTKELRGKGTIRVTKNNFILEVTLDDFENTLGSTAGIFGRSEFWEVRGIIEDEIEFVAHGLPSCSSKHFGTRPHATLIFSCGTLELMPSGYDRLTRMELAEHVAQVRRQALGESAAEDCSDGTSAPPKVKDELPKVSFYAVLANFKLMGRNGGTETVEKNDFLGESTGSKLDTCYGKLSDWSFGMIQRDADTHVYLRSQVDYESTDEAEDWRRFRAFLNAVGFMHGRHAWPLFIEQRREGRLVKDMVQLHGDVANTPHAPFDDKLAFNAKAGKIEWNLEEALQKAYAFFCSGSKLCKETMQLLFQFREATSPGVPERIGLLTLCALLESLVQAIYEEKIEPLKGPEISAFKAAKRQVCQELKLKAAQLEQEEAAAYSRVQTILGEARPVNFRMIYDSVVAHLGFKSGERWEAIYELWSSYRNPLAHRMTNMKDSEESTKANSAAESKIAGAINCIVLKLMGYSGVVQSSAFEAEYVTL